MGQEKITTKVVPEERIVNKIYLIRGRKVILDRDLARLYEVPTKRLNEQVRRNIKRFPEEFMFQLTEEELKNWRSQIATSNKDKMGLRRRPYVFNEQGIAMLSSVLNSDRAIEVNIAGRAPLKVPYSYLRPQIATSSTLLLW